MARTTYDQLAEKAVEFADAAIEVYGTDYSSAASQCFMKGPFAGFSIGDLLRLAHRLKEAPEPKFDRRDDQGDQEDG